jgi:septal ring factor EnvC (AmiA/AmiB activator)
MAQKFEQLIHGKAKGESSANSNYRIPLRAGVNRARTAAIGLWLAGSLALAQDAVPGTSAGDPMSSSTTSAAPTDTPGDALGGSPAPAAAAPPDADVKGDTEQLNKLRARIAALSKSLEQDRGQQDELRLQLEDVERKQAGLRAALKGIDARLAGQAEAVRKTQAQRAEAEALVGRHRKALGRQIRAAYVIGQRGQAKLLLNQDGVGRVSRVLTYYDYIARARAAHIREILAQAQSLAGLEARLQDETAALNVTRGQQQAALDALKATRAERRAMLRRLKQRIAGKEEELKAAQASEQQLAKLLEELRSALADVPADIGGSPFGQLKGKLPWPLRGRLLARFGEFKSGSSLKWNGLWIEAPEGRPVRAVARGRVAYVGWQHRYGLIAVLEHEGGYYTLYGHAQSVNVSVGDWVNAGDGIAAAGTSGGHEKSGLYFELRKGAEPVNPRLWLKRS